MSERVSGFRKKERDYGSWRVFPYVLPVPGIYQKRKWHILQEEEFEQSRRKFLLWIWKIPPPDRLKAVLLSYILFCAAEEPYDLRKTIAFELFWPASAFLLWPANYRLLLFVRNILYNILDSAVQDLAEDFQRMGRHIHVLFQTSNLAGAETVVSD